MIRKTLVILVVGILWISLVSAKEQEDSSFIPHTYLGFSVIGRSVVYIYGGSGEILKFSVINLSKKVGVGTAFMGTCGVEKGKSSAGSISLFPITLYYLLNSKIWKWNKEITPTLLYSYLSFSFWGMRGFFFSTDLPPSYVDIGIAWTPGLLIDFRIGYMVNWGATYPFNNASNFYAGVNFYLGGWYVNKKFGVSG